MGNWEGVGIGCLFSFRNYVNCICVITNLKLSKLHLAELIGDSDVLLSSSALVYLYLPTYLQLYLPNNILELKQIWSI